MNDASRPRADRPFQSIVRSKDSGRWSPFRGTRGLCVEALDALGLSAMTTDDYSAELQKWRDERDHFMAHHYATPLSDEDIAAFDGLEYFPPDSAWVFPVHLESAESPVAIEASSGAVSDYSGAGTVVVPFPAGPVTMQVLHGEEGELYIPFRDSTCGGSTYSGGRYVGVEPTDPGFVVDFNKATNPYCAYDPDFSCPLPPPGNRLQFAVEAGELDYAPPVGRLDE